MTEDGQTQEFTLDNPNATIDVFFSAMRKSTRWSPVGVEIEVSDELVLGDTASGDGCRVQIAPTMVKLVVRPEYNHYEYEFEGWLLRDAPDQIWVQGELNVDDDTSGAISLGYIRRLNQGEQVGTGPLMPYRKTVRKTAQQD